MDIEEADKIIRKAQDLIRRRNVVDIVEVDELDRHADWQRDSFVEVEGGTYVKGWVFVPDEE